MTDMVERVARAICQEEEYLPDRHYPSMRHTPAWKNYSLNARAAIEAAFQVTDEDARDFFDHGDADVEWPIWQNDLDAFITFKTSMQALSDAALKEES